MPGFRSVLGVTALSFLPAACESAILPHSISDLSSAFRGSSAFSHPSHVHNALAAESQKTETSSVFSLACSTYSDVKELTSFVEAHSHHPVLASHREDKLCYLVQTESTMSDELTNAKVKISRIPHIVKIDDSVEKLAEVAPISGAHRVLELAMGLGVGDKRTSSTNLDAARDIIDRVSKMHSAGDLSDHWSDYYWTSDSALNVAKASSSRDHNELLARRALYTRVTDDECDFSSLEIYSTKTHANIVFPPLEDSSLLADNQHQRSCMLLLASVAAINDHVSHISAYEGYESYASTSAPFNKNTTHEPTDQNAWLQSGNSLDTPYSDIGLNGEGYVLGMADSGIEDMSCFFIDDSKTRTPRTPKNDYLNPITDYTRRKVIQYVAYADGVPDLNYDHGTWCAGSSIGKCIEGEKKFRGAEAYNGLAPEAKFTMFDVQSHDKMFVPALYDIVLPPAYNAGARVHSNSWGCRGVTVYTSKALDVDTFMYENPDFLFVVAAGNDGALGMDSVGSPGVSKNALTIGASAENHNEIVYFSGIGKAFDGMIKPDVIGPGTNLMSAGVLNSKDEKCNVEISSGTSMATPLVSACAVLVRQYFEHKKFWGTFCNPAYRSCPRVIDETNHVEESAKPKAKVTGAFVKAALIHSAADMRKLLSQANSALPTTNLTEPPDRFQGWGQVILRNVLSLPGTYDFDLYTSFDESLPPMTRRTYNVEIKGRHEDLVATIAWTDPPNVVWAAKNLLNDLDLTVISPSGKVYYGNNRKGDEFNAVERVVVRNPEKGVYTVQVTAKHLIASPEQTYSMIITSDGYVQESMNFDVPVTVGDLTFDDVTMHCHKSGGHLIRMQLEDWNAGQSWHNIYFTIAKETSSSVGETVFIRTFRSNHDVRDSMTNRIDQFSVCLDPKTKYVASMVNLATPFDVDYKTSNTNNIRVTSPDCEMFISSFWPSSQIVIADGQCNYCPPSSVMAIINMFSNVTDDDANDYSWYGAAFYQVHSLDAEGKSTGVVMAGTLSVSDEMADRVCLPPGNYELRLNDDELAKLRHKHGAVEANIDGVKVKLIGTSSQKFTVGADPGATSVTRVGFYCLLAAIVAISAYMCLRWRSRAEEREAAASGSSAEMSRLL